MGRGLVYLQAPTQLELHGKCLEIEARGYEPVTKMVETVKVRKDFDYTPSKTAGARHRFTGYDMTKLWKIAYRKKAIAQ